MILSRFAPSPTGFIHIGNIKSLLNVYYYLLNNKNYYFYIRIDDSNYIKYNILYIKFLIKIINYFKVCFDKIIFQSNKFYRYIEYTQYLIYKKLIFFCYNDFVFNKFNRIYQNLNLKNFFIKKNKKKIIKKFILKVFFLKLNFFIFKKNFIILKSNGVPVYNYSSVLDDVDANINVIIRGIDHLNNLYIQILFFFIFNKKIPKIFHKEILLNELGNKISKRLNNNNFIKIKNNYFLESIISYIFNNYNNSLKKIISNNLLKRNFFLKLNFFNLFYINKKNIKLFNFFYLKKKIYIYIIKKFFFKKKIFYYIDFVYLKKFFKKFFFKLIDIKYNLIFNKNNFINISLLKRIKKKKIIKYIFMLIKKKKIILDNNYFFFLKLFYLNKKNFPYIFLFIKYFNKKYIFKKNKINYLNIKYIVPFV